MRLFLAFAAIGALASTARADVERSDGIDPKIKFEKYKLPNGLEVILAPDPSVPLVAVNVWYHVGSGDEVPGKSGFAHLFEHMMFQGSKNVGSDRHFAILRKLGSDEINGTTNADRTNYFEVVPANQLETGLWLESDRMGHLLDILDKGELDNQIDVVRNERRQRYDNVPYNKARFAMQAALYPEGHPYRYFTIGKHEDLVNASVDDVKRFFKTWYVPSNATLALVGDFDPAQAKQLVDKWFGSFPASTKPPIVSVPAPTIASQTIEVDDPLAKLRQVTFAWHSPAQYAPGDAELDIAAAALTEEGTGRLYRSLVYDKQLAQSVRASQSGSTFSGTFQITVTLRSNADLAQIEQIVADEVAKISREPLDAHEIDRVVAAQESRAIYRLESLNSRANVLQEFNQYFGDPDRITFDLDRYRKATADQIRASVARYLSPAHEVTVVTNPVAGAR
ncbi:MAG TPA: pitrilysin family protein [Kofleriaceae bacterium]|jgi:predicted Zn-dependent peptidase